MPLPTSSGLYGARGARRRGGMSLLSGLASVGLAYELEPRYPVIGNAITRGFGPLADELARMASAAPHAPAAPGKAGWAASPPFVALDGPAAIDWRGFVAQLGAELERR